jgi:hypothetical protein
VAVSQSGEPAVLPVAMDAVELTLNSGPALGRPRKDPAQSKAHRRQQHLDGRVLAKLARTSETASGPVMGLEKTVRVAFSHLVKCLVCSGHWPIYMEFAAAQTLSGSLTIIIS